VIIVHSFSRFFRDQFQLEFYARRLARNPVRLVSITKELGNDPMSNMIRQVVPVVCRTGAGRPTRHVRRHSFMAVKWAKE
jgi:site-specific DNA recombinase